MGSKGLKYVAVDAGQGRRAPARRRARTSSSSRKELHARPTRRARRCSRPAPARSCRSRTCCNTFPYKNRTAGQSPDAATLDGARIVESFATRGGGMHNCMTGCIVQCSNVVHDKDGNYKTSRARVRDADAARRELRGRELGGRRRPRPPLRRGRPRHDRDRRRDRGAHGLGRHGVGRRRGREGAARARSPRAPSSARRSATARSRSARSASTTACPVVQGPGDPGLGSAAAQGHGRHLLHEPDGRRPHGRPDREPGPAAGPVRARVAGGAARERGLRLVGLLPVPAADARRHPRSSTATLYGEEVTREQIADMGWQCLADEWEFNRRAGFTEADDVLADCMKQDPIGAGEGRSATSRPRSSGARPTRARRPASDAVQR